MASTTKAEVKAAREKHRAAAKDRRTETLGVIAKALGSTPDDVKARLKDGTSIAEQAKAKGVDRQVVDDALTKHLTAKIDAWREAGGTHVSVITMGLGLDSAGSHLDYLASVADALSLS